MRLDHGQDQSGQDGQGSDDDRDLGLSRPGVVATATATAATATAVGGARANLVVLVERGGNEHLRRTVLDNDVHRLVSVDGHRLASDDVQQLGVGIVREVGHLHRVVPRPGSSVGKDREHGRLGDDNLAIGRVDDRGLGGVKRRLRLTHGRSGHVELGEMLVHVGLGVVVGGPERFSVLVVDLAASEALT